MDLHHSYSTGFITLLSEPLPRLIIMLMSCLLNDCGIKKITRCEMQNKGVKGR